jgi:hypothetical protein
MMFNILTIDLEDYFQVQAFSNVIKVEDWDNYESRIERNTVRILEILNECIGPNNSVNSSNPTSVLSPHDSKFLPHTSNLQPHDSKFLPPTSNLYPHTLPKATFFILGWLAERYPHLIREIRQQGHEIGCHGYSHKLIYTQSKEEFREDIRKAKIILEDITGDEVISYRAPSYSITNKSQWAFEVLMEEGFKYDSSIFPIHHDFYGFPQAPRFPFRISLNGNNNFEFSLLNFETAALQHSNTNVLPPTSNGVLLQPPTKVDSINSSNPSNPSTWYSTLDTPNLNMHHNILASNEVLLKRSAPLTSSKLIEFPISTIRICGQNIPISGGGYFRLFPYSLIKKGLRRINEEEEQPFIFYIHPWEIDPDQPRMNSISRKSKFRHYINLDKTESRFKKLLTDFNFSSIKDLLKTNIITAALNNNSTTQ